MLFNTLLVACYPEEVTLFVGWHERDTGVHKTFGDIERGSTLVKISVPVESDSAFVIDHSSVSSGSIIDGDSVLFSISTWTNFPDNWSVHWSVPSISTLVS